MSLTSRTSISTNMIPLKSTPVEIINITGKGILKHLRVRIESQAFIKIIIDGSIILNHKVNEMVDNFFYYYAPDEHESNNINMPFIVSVDNANGLFRWLNMNKPFEHSLIIECYSTNQSGNILRMSYIDYLLEV